VVSPAPAFAAPEGQMTWALHFSLAPTLFEPAETPGVVSRFMILYALHEALVKPMLGKAMAPSLAESWSVSVRRVGHAVKERRGRSVHSPARTACARSGRGDSIARAGRARGDGA